MLRRCGLIILALSLFTLYSNLTVSAQEDEGLKVKIKQSLETLKRTLLKEQTMLRTENEGLLTQNRQLIEENAQLRQDLAKKAESKPVVVSSKGEERVVYKADPKQEEAIEGLNEKLKSESELVVSLRKQLSDASQESKGLKAELIKADKEFAKKESQLSNALKEAEVEEVKLAQEIRSLKGQVKGQPKEKVIYRSDPKQEEQIQELKQKIAELSKFSGDKTDNRLVNENIRMAEALQASKAKQSTLTQEIASLKGQLKGKPRTKEKVIYRPDPKQKEQIRDLKQKIAVLEGEVKNKSKKIVQKDKRIRNLQDIVEDADQWIKEMLW